jgi:putative transposase
MSLTLGQSHAPEIFDTDQGSQFTGAVFTERPHAANIHISMDGKGCWRDDVFVERLWNDQVRGGLPARQ